MARVFWAAVLLVLLGTVVANGLTRSWTSAHVVFGGALAALAVLVLLPSKAKAAAGSRG